jgi:hypothetical protein
MYINLFTGPDMKVTRHLSPLPVILQENSRDEKK